MLDKRRILIRNIPTLVWGQDSDKVYIYVHGKMGSKENAEHFAEIAISRGYQVVSFDLPEHGERKEDDYSIMPWNAVQDLKDISKYAMNNWKEINLYACSLGAYFSLLAYKDINIKKSLFQCPVLNMEKLISNMMEWFNITEEQLKIEKEIPTTIGETLYWDYWIYVNKNPIDEWKSKTYILYPSKDNLTDRETVDNFMNTHSVNLTVLDNAEHYFKEEKHLNELEVWLQNNI
ncbi:MAG: alpha/beta hydrolase [Clostridium sp.]|uniref:alpha/beta hydrolase n=1 Tax=Clostridium sp. TaxID=1506 RepID=UPI0025C738E9|nr:alpha/beta hydrolase [Clostridium sp.]MCF0147214.1 alpha/beta hydrolase [Clostridium sp.]